MKVRHWGAFVAGVSLATFAGAGAFLLFGDGNPQNAVAADANPTLVRYPFTNDPAIFLGMSWDDLLKFIALTAVCLAVFVFVVFSKSIRERFGF